MNKSLSILLLFSGLFFSSVAQTSFYCNCWIERDSTWNVAPFNGSGGSGGPGLPPDYRNDDWSTPAIALPFTFCFYGSNTNAVFINNNGNISIGFPVNAFFASNLFPDPNYMMIAPFFSDVDTRDPNSGIIYYQLTATHLIVQWDGVGYYMTHSDKRNWYQLIITDGSDPILSFGKNASFCYRRMEWTTGDADGGMNGFGGFPAIVGSNKGDGVTFFQIGLFNNDSADYDGPFGNNDGIRFLNNRSFQFNFCDSSFNVPPIALQSSCDTIPVCWNDTLTLNLAFSAPEAGQTVHLSLDSGGMILSNVTQTMNVDTAFMNITIIGSENSWGYYRISVTAIDNAVPSDSIVTSYLISVCPPITGLDQSSNKAFSVFPNPATSSITIQSEEEVRCQYYLFEQTGRLLKEGSWIGKTSQLNVSDLEQGIYSMKVVTQKGSYTILLSITK